MEKIKITVTAEVKMSDLRSLQAQLGAPIGSDKDDFEKFNGYHAKTSTIEELTNGEEVEGLREIILMTALTALMQEVVILESKNKS